MFDELIGSHFDGPPNFNGVSYKKPQRREGVYFISDSSYSGWSHEHTDKIWESPQRAAYDFIHACNQIDIAEHEQFIRAPWNKKDN